MSSEKRVGSSVASGNMPAAPNGGKAKRAVPHQQFLNNYDRAKFAMQNIVDMKDRDIDLFIRLCVQGNGSLSQKKHSDQFAKLTDEEVMALGKVVCDNFGYADAVT